MVSLEEFCDVHAHLSENLFSLCLTYVPILLFMLKVLKGGVSVIFHIICFVVLAYVFGFFVYERFGTTNKVALSLGAFVTLIWLIWCLVVVVDWLIVRIRMCCLGRQYILAPGSHVLTPHGCESLTDCDFGIFVVKKPGSTTVGGKLVSGIKEIVLRGRKASKIGNVNLHKYA